MTVIEALAALDQDLSLLKPYVKAGHRHDCTRCPVAIYIKEVTDEPMIAVGVNNVRVRGTDAVRIPNRVKEFIIRYDSGDILLI